MITSTITIAGAQPYLLDANVTASITHTFNGDIDMTVMSPAGTIVTLTTDNAGTNANVFAGTTWDDDANPGGQVPYVNNNGLTTDHLYADLVTVPLLAPEEALAAFIGENPNGVWTLTISDDANQDGGSFNGWTLNLATLPAAPATAVIPTATNSVPVPITNASVAVRRSSSRRATTSLTST